MADALIALCDANNYYVSCERAFDYSLVGKPVGVLRNNDGCIIARSNELKALKVPMGSPVFKYRDIIKQYQVILRSSNYPLYADLSHRMGSIFSEFSSEADFYSIDEVFLKFPTTNTASGIRELTSCARSIRQAVLRGVGIPLTVSLAPTKTLAKAANERAKGDPRFAGVLNLAEYSSQELEALLTATDISDVWGIGSRRAVLLRQHGINTALELRNAPDKWILQNLTITGLRTVWELRGVSCIPMELAPTPKKAICCAKSFGRPVESLTELREATATYVSRVAEKLRQQSSHANVLQVFIHTNLFRQGQTQYQNSATVQLPQATNFTPELVEYANIALSRIYKPGYQYQKVGVLVTDISPQNQVQLNLFSSPDQTDNLEALGRKARLMTAMDKINSTYGRDTLRVATAGTGEQGWKMRRAKLSKAYTTRWDELLTVTA